MHEYLPFIAALGIGVPIAITVRWHPYLAGLFCGGLGALFQLLVR